MEIEAHKRQFEAERMHRKAMLEAEMRQRSVSLEAEQREAAMRTEQSLAALEFKKEQELIEIQRQIRMEQDALNQTSLKDQMTIAENVAARQRNLDLQVKYKQLEHIEMNQRYATHHFEPAGDVRRSFIIERTHPSPIRESPARGRSISPHVVPVGRPMNYPPSYLPHNVGIPGSIRYGNGGGYQYQSNFGSKFTKTSQTTKKESSPPKNEKQEEVDEKAKEEK